MSLLKRFTFDKSGNFAIIFAICIVPIFGAAGLAVDYSRIYSARSHLQQAADAAVLAAVNEAQAKIADGRNQNASMKLGEVLGRALFASNVEPISDYVSSIEFKVDVAARNGVISGDGAVSGVIAGTLARAIGIKTAALSVTAKAEAGLAKYLEIHFLVDTSASMGVGATTSDQQIMANVNGCAIACHTVNPHWNFPNSLPSARAAGATLRIDVVRDAIGLMVDEFEAQGVSGSRLRLVLHTFSNTVTTHIPATTDLVNFRAGLSTLDMNGEDLEGGTDFTAALNTLESQIGNSGSGFGPGDREKIVLLVTDGVATNTVLDSNSWVGVDYNRNFTAFSPQYFGNQPYPTQGFNPRDCDRLKNRRKVKMATLNVRYVIPTVGTDNDPRFSEIEKFLLPDIEEHMRQCASEPSLAMWADSPETILSVMKTLATELTGGDLRLTQ
jgi:Flp pilus assembly protein TadG